MDRQELSSLMNRLRAELESGQAIDEDLRQSLVALDEDIRRLLSQPGAAAVPVPDEASLNERAQQLEARFAAEHPYLANTLRDVMDSLGKMGI